MKNQQSRELVKIKLPKNVGVNSIATLFEICNQIKTTVGDLELDCSEVTFFDPLGMTALAAVLESIDSSRRISMTWLSRNLSTYLDRMNFFSRIDVEGVEITPNRTRHDQSGSLLEITLFRDGDSSEMAAEKFATAVVGKMIGRGPKPTDFHVRDTEYDQYYIPLRYALSELIENALTHARREGRRDASVWIASQYYDYKQDNGMVQIAVVDNGCGFLATLRNHVQVREASHAAAILAALKSRVSCNRDLGLYGESVNQGVGLTTTVAIAKATGGDVHIVSGDALIFEKHIPSVKRKDRIFSLKGAWDGVAISATFDRKKLPTVCISDLLPPDAINQHKAIPVVDLNFVD